MAENEKTFKRQNREIGVIQMKYLPNCPCYFKNRRKAESQRREIDSHYHVTTYQKNCYLEKDNPQKRWKSSNAYCPKCGKPAKKPKEIK